MNGFGVQVLALKEFQRDEQALDAQELAIITTSQFLQNTACAFDNEIDPASSTFAMSFICTCRQVGLLFD